MAVSGLALSVAFPVSIFVIYRIHLRVLDPNHDDEAKIVKIVKKIKEKRKAREERVKALF